MFKLPNRRPIPTRRALNNAVDNFKTVDSIAVGYSNSAISEGATMPGVALIERAGPARGLP